MNSKAVFAVICIVCISVFIACSDSPNEDEMVEVPDNKQPSLENMVYIPAGEFIMGSEEGEGAFDEHPQHKVYLDAYYIDKSEVTNAQFSKFVEETGYVTDAERKGYGEVWNPKLPRAGSRNFGGVNWLSPHGWIEDRAHLEAWENYQPSEKMDNPVVQISWNDAQAYANWAGKRLPTEAEWERAARGTDGRKYPWGNLFNLDIGGVTVHANIDSDDLMPVECFPTGISPYEVYNMAGNVREWIADWYDSDYYTRSPENNPQGPETGEFRVLRGGSWRNKNERNVIISNRAYQLPDYSSNFVGFRCVWSSGK